MFLTANQDSLDAMPANRRPVDRQAKRDEIVRAAAGLFIDVGFDETPMTQLAAAAGVTTNTVYWYFEDKDALLVAVLDLLLDEALQEQAQQAPAPWVEQVLWAVERLERFHRLVAVVHARSAGSPSVAAWHDRFHGLADALLAEGFRQAGVPERDVVPATRMGVFVVEGLLTHPQDEQSRRAVIELLTTGFRRQTTPPAAADAGVQSA
jgi:AcrR family transcriptional regulator